MVSECFVLEMERMLYNNALIRVEERQLVLMVEWSSWRKKGLLVQAGCWL